MNVTDNKLDINQVFFDPENPRIAQYLDMEAGTEPNPEHIAHLLQPDDAKFLELKSAIRTSKGITNRIIVQATDDGYKVIEGNTRLAIYKTFAAEYPIDETWKHIPAVIYDTIDPTEVHKIRLQAHLVGARSWSPYARAKYLYLLSEEGHIPAQDLVDYVGGNKNKVLRNIAAYKLMEGKYRSKIPSDKFETEKFSIFFEYQKPNLKKALGEAKYTENDFVQWVVDGKFEPRQELVRQLPAILRNQRSKEVFEKRGAAEAIKFIDRPELKKELLECSLTDLAQALIEKVDAIPRRDITILREDSEAQSTLDDAAESLKEFVEHELSD